MEQKRFILFVPLAIGFLLVWQLFVLPRFAPKPEVKKNVTKGEAAKGDSSAAKVAKPKPAKPSKRTVARHSEVVLGSPDKASGFRLVVKIDSEGATVADVTLNDPAYPEETNRELPLRLIGHDNPQPLTFQTRLQTLQRQDTAIHADTAHWEVVPGSKSDSSVTYRLEHDGLELRKKYTLGKVDPAKPKDEGPAYRLEMKFSILNKTGEEVDYLYVLNGPCSLPLENREYTRRYRDVVGLFADGTFDRKTPSQILKTPENWQKPIRYVGVDPQYFSALVSPLEDQGTARTVQAVTQATIKIPGEVLGEPDKADTTVLLESVPLKIANNGEVTHGYSLFAGPKRDDLVDGHVLNFGWFDVISRFLLVVLNFFYGLVGNYGVAIMCLTVAVRLCMLPISIKQARSMARMQALQPEMNALKQKYGDDKEKLGAATMALYAKHGVNPFGGCLLVLPQMPIFIGLYSALQNSVNLRMAPFLWVNNLAAPEMLFRLPFHIPLIGEHFNLLPLVTMSLYFVQQLLFTPPAVDEQGKQQQMVMYIMLPVMCLMFYQVPAGLCLYFIASSTWSICERLAIGKLPPPKAVPPADDRRDGRDGKDGDDDKPAGPPGFWAKLLAAAEKETQLRREKSTSR